MRVNTKFIPTTANRVPKRLTDPIIIALAQLRHSELVQDSRGDISPTIGEGSLADNIIWLQTREHYFFWGSINQARPHPPIPKASLQDLKEAGYNLTTNRWIRSGNNFNF